MPFKTYDETMAQATEEGKKLEPSSQHDSKPESILIAPAPDRLNEAVLTETKALEKALSFTFTEVLWAPRAFLEASAEKRAKRGNFHYAPDEVHEHVTGLPHDAWMLVNMGALGYGLMARDTIPPGRFLFNYTGEFVSAGGHKQTNSAYGIGIQDNFFGMQEDDGSWDPMDAPLSYNFSKPGVIEALDYRNFSAFAQHAPEKIAYTTDPERYFVDYVFENSDVLESAAICNAYAIRREPTYIDGMTCHEFHASPGIAAGMMVFINYGCSYWPGRRRHPELFTKQGIPIAYNQYYPNDLYLEDSGDKTLSVKTKTAIAFSALLNGKGTANLSFSDLKKLTIQHLGEERFKGHLTCFLRKNPKVVLGYRKDRFFSKKPEEHDGTEQFKSRMRHFGFTFFDSNNSIDLEKSNPKLPGSAINSIFS